MFKPGQKVYWVKYALTSGIHVREFVEYGPLGRSCRIKSHSEEVGFIFTSEKELFTELKDAIDYANLLREKKIKSLDKQREKLENLTFLVNE